MLKNPDGSRAKGNPKSKSKVKKHKTKETEETVSAPELLLANKWDLEGIDPTVDRYGWGRRGGHDAYMRLHTEDFRDPIRDQPSWSNRLVDLGKIG